MVPRHKAVSGVGGENQFVRWLETLASTEASESIRRPNLGPGNRTCSENWNMYPEGMPPLVLVSRVGNTGKTEMSKGTTLVENASDVCLQWGMVQRVPSEDDVSLGGMCVCVVYVAASACAVGAIQLTAPAKLAESRRSDDTVLAEVGSELRTCNAEGEQTARGRTAAQEGFRECGLVAGTYILFSNSWVYVSSNVIPGARAVIPQHEQSEIRRGLCEKRNNPTPTIHPPSFPVRSCTALPQYANSPNSPPFTSPRHVSLAPPKSPRSHRLTGSSSLVSLLQMLTD